MLTSSLCRKWTIRHGEAVASIKLHGWQRGWACTQAYGAFMDFQGGRYGLAILSRRPIQSHESWRLPEGNEPRVALATRIETDAGKVVTAVAVHFDWVKDDGFRYAQAMETLRQIQTLDTPWIVFGDFNDVPESRTMNAFRQVGKDATKPRDSATTFPADQPRIEIDYIMTGPPSCVGPYAFMPRSLRNPSPPTIDRSWSRTCSRSKTEWAVGLSQARQNNRFQTKQRSSLQQSPRPNHPRSSGSKFSTYASNRSATLIT